MIENIRKFGLFANAGSLPFVGNAIHKHDSPARLVANSIIAKAVVSAVAFVLTWKFTNNLQLAGIIAGSIAGGLLLLQGLDYAYHKYKEDDNAAAKSAADTGAIIGIATIGVAPLISFAISKVATKLNCAKLEVLEVQGVSAAA